LDLELGDKIEIEIGDIQKIDLPKKRYRSDKEVQENPFTDEEWRELRYKDYLDLKKEFEGKVR
jgi:predicted RNA-binding protein